MKTDRGVEENTGHVSAVVRRRSLRTVRRLTWLGHAECTDERIESLVVGWRNVNSRSHGKEDVKTTDNSHARHSTFLK